MTDRSTSAQPPYTAALVSGIDLIRVAVICDNGFPSSDTEKDAVIAGAWPLMAESLTRRGIAVPPGCVLAINHPDTDWRDSLSQHIVNQAEAELASAPPAAAVAVVRLIWRQP